MSHHQQDRKVRTLKAKRLRTQNEADLNLPISLGAYYVPGRRPSCLGFMGLDTVPPWVPDPAGEAEELSPDRETSAGTKASTGCGRSAVSFLSPLKVLKLIKT